MAHNGFKHCSIKQIADNRRILKEDIALVNKFVVAFRINVAALDPTFSGNPGGRGKKGITPSFTLALHYIIRGLTPFQAAEEYVRTYRECGNGF